MDHNTTYNDYIDCIYDNRYKSNYMG